VILVVDSSALALMVHPAAVPPVDPVTNQPLEHSRARVEHLIESFTANDSLIIPTPVLAEALVRAEDGAPGILEAISGMARVKIRPFGERAAVETAFMTRQAIQSGDKKGGSSAAWQKVKVDRQIIAVARVEGATAVYADDKDLVAFAKRLGMTVFSTWELPVPESAHNLFTAGGLEPDGRVEDASRVSAPPKRAINLDAPISDKVAGDEPA